MESVPQTYILLIIALADGGNRVSVLDLGLLFCMTYSLSVTSASFGIAKFLKSGPARIVRCEQFIDGYGTLTFILIFFNVAATQIGRGLQISFVLPSIAYFGLNEEDIHAGLTQVPLHHKLYYLLIVLSFLPQLVHVS